MPSTPASFATSSIMEKISASKGLISPMMARLAAAALKSPNNPDAGMSLHNKFIIVHVFHSDTGEKCDPFNLKTSANIFSDLLRWGFETNFGQILSQLLEQSHFRETENGPGWQANS